MPLDSRGLPLSVLPCAAQLYVLQVLPDLPAPGPVCPKISASIGLLLG